MADKKLNIQGNAIQVMMGVQGLVGLKSDHLRLLAQDGHWELKLPHSFLPVAGAGDMVLVSFGLAKISLEDMLEVPEALMLPKDFN